MRFRLLVLPLIGLCAALTAPSSRAVDDNRPDTAERRARSIVSARCFSCHGVDGLATTAQFPKLAGQNADYLVRQMFNFQSRARVSVVMEEQMAGLIGGDIEALAAYYAARPMLADPPGNAKDMALGRKVYFEGNPKTGLPACATCHGPEARGARWLPRLAGQHALYLERQLKAFASRARKSDQAQMHSVAGKLKDAEIKAVSAFLSAFE